MQHVLIENLIIGLENSRQILEILEQVYFGWDSSWLCQLLSMICDHDKADKFCLYYFR